MKPREVIPGDENNGQNNTNQADGFYEQAQIDLN
jgi:hypothetical protein